MSEEHIKHRGLNDYGVKNSADMWRTIDGVVWPQYSSERSPADLKAYRAAGIRARRFGEETFIHPDDVDRASELDREARRS